VSETSSKLPASKRRTPALQNWREAVPDDRLGLLIKDALRGLNRAMQMRITEHSVSYGHWAFLRILWQEDGLTQRALSERAGVQEPTTFSALKAMEKLGYIERRQLPDNRKNVYIYLTPEGRALEQKLLPLALEVNEQAIAGVPAADVAATRRTLLAIIDNMVTDETSCPIKGKRRMPSTRELAGIVARRAEASAG
jgi:DNA-binding MarR family transcriptional regulator